MIKKGDVRPPYQRIASDLRAQIMSGDLEPGTQLPSTPQLVEQYEAANTTIQKALSALKDEGFLRSQMGKGVYVRDRKPFVIDAVSYFAPAPEGYTYQLLEVAEVRPPAEVVDALELEAGGTAWLRSRLTLHAGEPVELSWSYYPVEIAAGSPLASRGKIRGGAPKILAELGCPQRELIDQLSVRQPTSAEVEALELPVNVPVIRQFRVIYSDDRRPVEASVMVKGGHRYELRYRQAVLES